MKEKLLSKIRESGIDKGLKVSVIAGSIFEIIIALVMIIFPSASTEVVGYIVGAAFIVYGVFCLLAILIKPLIWFLGFNISSGLLSIICGIAILLFPGTVLSILCIVLGLLVIVCGFALSFLSFIMLAFGHPTWWVSLIFSFLFGISGLIIIFNPGFTGSVLMVFIGIILLLEAATNFFALYKLNKLSNTKPPQQSINNAIDADFVDVDD